MRIHIEQHPNKDFQTVHLDRPTTSKPYSKYDDKGGPKKVQRLEQKFRAAIEFQDDSILGSVRMKEISIKRNPVFTWEQVHAKTVEILKAYFKVDEIEVIVGERDPEWDIPRSEREEMY